MTSRLERLLAEAEDDWNKIVHGHELAQAAVPNALGEDRSSYQAIAPWTGWAFGFVKATEGAGLVDNSFPVNWDNLAKTGKPRGAYCFFHPGENAVAQADLLYATVRNAGLRPGDMFVLDVEILVGASLGATRRTVAPASLEDLGLTGPQIDAAALACLNRLRQLAGPGHPILVYTNHAVGQYLHKTAAAYPHLWFAYPGRLPTAALIAPWKSWLFWQTGVVSGTDRDQFNGSATALAKWITTYEPAPKPIATPPEEDMILVSVDKKTVPPKTPWPGVFVYPPLDHVETPADEASLITKLGPPVTITYRQYQKFGAA